MNPLSFFSLPGWGQIPPTNQPMERFLSEIYATIEIYPFVYLCAVRIDSMTYDGDSCYETCVYDNVQLDVNLYMHVHT